MKNQPKKDAKKKSQNPIYFKRTLSQLRVSLNKKEQVNAEEKIVELCKMLLNIHK
jgi:hypothetical protein